MWAGSFVDQSTRWNPWTQKPSQPENPTFRADTLYNAQCRTRGRRISTSLSELSADLFIATRNAHGRFSFSLQSLPVCRLYLSSCRRYIEATTPFGLEENIHWTSTMYRVRTYINPVKAPSTLTSKGFFRLRPPHMPELQSMESKEASPCCILGRFGHPDFEGAHILIQESFCWVCMAS